MRKTQILYKQVNPILTCLKTFPIEKQKKKENKTNRLLKDKRVPNIFFLLVLVIAFSGCEKDYDIDKKFKEQYTPKAVVNSIICPQLPIQVKLSWSKKYDDINYHSPITDFTLNLFEEDNLVTSSSGTFGIASTNYYPTEGKTYRIEVNVPDYGIVLAETSIPQKAEAEVSFIKRKESYMHFEIKDIYIPESKRAIWIKPYTKNPDDTEKIIYDIYTINPFPDQLNSFLETWNLTYTESNIGYEYYLRLPRQQIQPALPLHFSIQHFQNSPWFEWDEDGNIITHEPDENSEVIIKTITPSDDYDKYYRSLYKQELFSYDSDFPIFGETVQVYSNIQNGLGIFAGYTVSIAKFNEEGGKL